MPSGCPDDLGPLQLAWLGDAVWEMHQRIMFCKTPARSKDLHEAVVSKVNAESQAKALSRLEVYLTDVEKQLVRRGRNKVGRGSRKLDVAIYSQATGFETLIGWLFLKNPARLAQILDRLEENESFCP
ncbi:hypothetical protein EV05_1854 [Prochlorococcus sp. MIT 0601]|nr:hypothetical protein EV05_1854 [Prochlorococcus sp. MIT 0601]